MFSSNIDILALWYEGGGLNKMKIEAIFTLFKLVTIFIVTSLPFWLQFHKEHYDITDVTISLQLWGLWIYYLVTYMIMTAFILRPLFKKVDQILRYKEFFSTSNLNINTTEGVDINKMIQISGSQKEDFLVEALRYENVLLGLEDKQYLTTPLFTSLLGTYPLEIMMRATILQYYFSIPQTAFKDRDENTINFKKSCKMFGIAIIPFLPAILIFSIVNHVITYIHNGNFLSTYEYNRFGLWKFRHYNEFIIQTKKRLEKTKTTSEEIVVNLFLESWRSSFSKAISYLFSMISVFLLIFSLNGFERFFGIDIIPLISVCTVSSIIMFPKSKNQDSSMSTLRAILKKDLSRHELGDYFESKLSILIKEVFSILWLPVALFFILPERAHFISEFISQHYHDARCTWSQFNNKDATPKTKFSYFAISTDVGSSDLITV